MRHLTDRPKRNGFTIVELIVAMAVIAVVTAVSLPTLATYWQTATLSAGAQELAAVLGRARQLAIRQNGYVCVERTGNQIRFRTATAPNCAGTIWTSEGTDANGWLSLTNRVQVSNATASPIFTYLGIATPGATFTVRNPVNSATQTVTVAGSGRVSVP